MLRSVKSLCVGSVAVALIGGGVAYAVAGTDKTVLLKVDGQTTKITTSADNVKSALASAKYKIGEHDVVAPAADSVIQNGQTVVLKRGRLLHLTIDGKSRDVWTTAPTVAEALKELGYGEDAAVSVSRSKRLPLTHDGDRPADPQGRDRHA